MEARKVVRQVYLDEKIEQYIADIVFATRFPEKYDLKELKDMIGFGGSPRDILADDFLFFFQFRIVDNNFQHKTVYLGFGKRLGTFLFNRSSPHSESNRYYGSP